MFDALVAGKKKPGAAPTPQTRAVSNGVLRRKVGERFVSAREINGWGQSEASLMLGYKNSTQLSLIEAGRRLPPHEVLLRASTVYGVSTDFLYSLTEEAERDHRLAEKRAALRQVQSLLESQADTISGFVFDYVANGAPTVMTTRTLLEDARKLADTVKRFHEINAKRFDTLRGGAPVLKALGLTQSAIAYVDQVLFRHDHFVEKADETARRKREAESRERALRRLRERQRDEAGLSTAPDQLHLHLSLDTTRPAANEARQ